MPALIYFKPARGITAISFLSGLDPRASALPTRRQAARKKTINAERLFVAFIRFSETTFQISHFRFQCLGVSGFIFFPDTWAVFKASGANLFMTIHAVQLDGIRF